MMTQRISFYGRRKSSLFSMSDTKPTTQDAFVERINEAFEDLEAIEDYFVTDTDDPEVIDITIRGRLKKDIGRPVEQKQDPDSDDYDRAMRGLSPCINSQTTSSNN